MVDSMPPGIDKDCVYETPHQLPFAAVENLSAKCPRSTCRFYQIPRRSRTLPQRHVGPCAVREQTAPCFWAGAPLFPSCFQIGGSGTLRFVWLVLFYTGLMHCNRTVSESSVILLLYDIIVQYRYYCTSLPPAPCVIISNKSITFLPSCRQLLNSSFNGSYTET